METFVTLSRANKPDAVNPGMAVRFAFEDQWRRVTDLERWAKAHAFDYHIARQNVGRI